MLAAPWPMSERKRSHHRPERSGISGRARLPPRSQPAEACRRMAIWPRMAISHRGHMAFWLSGPLARELMHVTGPHSTFHFPDLTLRFAAWWSSLVPPCFTSLGVSTSSAVLAICLDLSIVAMSQVHHRPSLLPMYIMSCQLVGCGEYI